MKTQCPTCKTVQEVPDSYVGQNVKCSECKRQFVSEASDIIFRRDEKVKPNRPKVEHPPQRPGRYLQVLGVIVILIGGITAFFNMIVSNDATPFCLSILGGLVLCGLGTIANLLADFRRVI